jgi:hypothetical protein
MRIAFISDIHGHFQALYAVLSDISKNRVQSVVCLGDVISLGPHPREVIELLQRTDCQGRDEGSDLVRLALRA